MPELIRLLGYGLFAAGVLCAGWVIFETVLRLVFKDDYGNDDKF